MSDTFSKVEVIPGVARRRRFTTEQKLLVVNETLQPGMSISYVARRHGLSPSLVCGFRGLRPGIPIEREHAFRSKAATCSDEGGRVSLPA